MARSQAVGDDGNPRAVPVAHLQLRDDVVPVQAEVGQHNAHIEPELLSESLMIGLWSRFSSNGRCEIGR